MMLALMALVLALGLDHYLRTTDMFWGDDGSKSCTRARLHALLSGLAGLRRRPVVVGRLEHTNLVGAMITGVKTRRGPEPGPRPCPEPGSCEDHAMKSLLPLFIVGGLACAASLAVAGERPGSREVRQLREAGKILPAEEILMRSRKGAARPGGRPRAGARGGRLIYEVKLIDNANRSTSLGLDAATGDVLRRRGK